MLNQLLLEKLIRLRLPSFREGLPEQWENPHHAELAFKERLGLLVDLECTRWDHSPQLDLLQSGALCQLSSVL